jgi:hypothetical protein
MHRALPIIITSNIEKYKVATRVYQDLIGKFIHLIPQFTFICDLCSICPRLKGIIL